MSKRTWLYAALTLSGGFIGGVAATQLAPSAAIAARAARSVKAGAFVLVDSAGTKRAALQMTDDSSSELVMYDASGRERANILVTKDGVGTIGFSESMGAPKVLIGAAPGGRDGVTLYGHNNKLLAGLTVGTNDESSLTLYDPNSGRARAGLGVATDGSPALVLFDSNGKDRAELHVRPSGKPGLALADESGKSIAGLPAKAPASEQ